jgi:hypothetical protein
MPLLINVHNFSGVRIHSGNTAKDTWGCILVGQAKGVNQIMRSRLAYEALFQKIELASRRRHPIWIEIRGLHSVGLEEAAKSIGDLV